MTAITTAHGAGTPNQASCARNRCDEVIEVIRRTHDGDDLEPADLALSQHLVNNGWEGLSDAGRRRWDQVLAEVRAGTYVKPWLHGNEHLTRDHAGYVYWRGQQVEHYDFPASRREAEAKAASRLAAACRLLERRGLQVSSRAIFDVWDCAHFGEGQDLPRWAVFWAVDAKGDRLRLCVYPMEARTHDEAVFERGELSGRAMEVLGVPRRSLRMAMVVSREDFDAVRQAVEGDLRWAERALMRSTQQTSEDRRGSIVLLDQEIGARVLPSREALEESLLQEAASALTSAGDATSQPCPPRERG